MWRNTRPAVLWIPSTIFVVVIAAGIISPKTFIEVLTKGFEALQVGCGWIVSCVTLSFVIFCVAIMFLPIGNIRLGGPNAKPKMTYWQWFAIALCAGIGTGVVFWGAVEPLLFSFEAAPSLHLEPGSNAAVTWAMRTTFLHWTFTPYAIYVAFGVILAYVCYNMKKPFTASSCLIPLVGDAPCKGRLGTAIDVITVFALMGGVAGSLGWGLLQLSKGVEIVFGIPRSPIVYFVICAAIVASYLATSISGLRRGILWLGDQNAKIYVILLIFMLVCGPTAYICNLFTQSVGDYFQHFLEAATFTSPFPDSKNWPQWWDQFWWVDWLSYGPLMGLFLVRLGYGRTLRQFVVVNLVLPSVFGFIWFSVFGGTVLHHQFFGGIDYYALYKKDGAEVLTLAALDNLPLAWCVKAFMLLVIAISFITLANAMISTIASISSKDSSATREAPVAQKLFWGLLIGGASLLFTMAGGIEGLKMVKTYCGYPIVFLGLAMMIGFISYMARRPRLPNGDYEYEKAVANAPDSGEPPVPVSPRMKKIQARIEKLFNPAIVEEEPGRKY